MQIHLVGHIMSSLLEGIPSQVERGTEAVVLLSCVLEAAHLLQPGRLSIMGRCIRTVLGAVSQGLSPTPTCLSNILSCLDIPRFAVLLLANPQEDSGLKDADSEGEGTLSVEQPRRHVAELLGLAMACLSKAGGQVAGASLLNSLLSQAETFTGELWRLDTIE